MLLSSIRFAATSFLLTLMSSPLATAQACPDQVAEEVGATQEAKVFLDCGGTTGLGNLQVSWTGRCPAVLVVTPAHHVQRHVPGSGTFVEVLSRQPVVHYTFECKSKWILFIPIGSRCSLKGRFNAGTVSTMATLPCTDPGAQS